MANLTIFTSNLVTFADKLHNPSPTTFHEREIMEQAPLTRSLRGVLIDLPFFIFNLDLFLIICSHDPWGESW